MVGLKQFVIQTSQAGPELGTAQPQLVLIIIIFY
jgi:hypothetical protein